MNYDNILDFIFYLILWYDAQCNAFNA